MPMLLEEQRFLHEHMERIEDATADRFMEDPRNMRERQGRDHEIGRFLQQAGSEAEKLADIYKDEAGERDQQLRDLSTGDVMDKFEKELASIKDFHRRYPNEPVENLEKIYKKRSPEERAAALAVVETMFTGEEGFGRFFDLNRLHEQYINLPIFKQVRRVTYLQYLDSFDIFVPPQCLIARNKKLDESYFQYLKALRDYLDSFIHRTKPLENLDKLFESWDKEFVEKWANGELPGWGKEDPVTKAPTNGDSGHEFFCAPCQKGFSKETTYEGHLKSKKHTKTVQSLDQDSNPVPTKGTTSTIQDFKERAVAELEYRIKKLAGAMQTERSDTRTNVERKQGMTERERQQELELLYADDVDTNGGEDEKDDEDEKNDKIYNPLKLPLAWDGKPIPYWLYKLHGLGVELPCEICGNYVYMGRRAFDKHFNEPRHIYGLKCLGIVSQTNLFREITSIDAATALWKKIVQDNKAKKKMADDVIQMEDNEGNVMPEKVYYDLLAQGLL
ncbi:splicesome-associated protein [Amniculicola lignicola CBS 123094]|uniref:Splicesome-associated protein n=1 Tax=Amniculicola lignicola CBS 123094 TaxID=1392246 RepID=A0A6A5W882_9PLEO|nr:splicesome-associated protein [Amniculicola lignicola CBS 123094]